MRRTAGTFFYLKNGTEVRSDANFKTDLEAYIEGPEACTGQVEYRPAFWRRSDGANKMRRSIITGLDIGS
jgi:hypothetical protein